MSLIGGTSNAIAESNLRTILNVDLRSKGVLDHFVSQIALDRFEEYKLTKTHLSHHVQKFAILSALYGVGLIAPLGFLTWQTYLTYTHGWIDVTGFGVTVTTNKVWLDLAGISVAAYLADKIKPLQVAIHHTTNQLTSLATLTKDQFLKRYTSLEKAEESAHEEYLKDIKKHFKKMFKTMSDHLDRQFQIRNKKSSEILELKREVSALRKRVPLIKEALSNLEIPPDDQKEILKDFLASLRTIDDFDLTLISGEFFREHNASIMADVPPDYFRECCIPHVAKVHLSDLDKMGSKLWHQFKLVTAPLTSSTIASATIPALATGVLKWLGDETFNLAWTCAENLNYTGECYYLGITAGSVGAVALVVFVVVGHGSYKLMACQLKDHVEVIAHHQDYSTREISEIYDGIGIYLGEKKDRGMRAKIEAKVVILKEELKKRGLPADKLTQGLERSLGELKIAS